VIDGQTAWFIQDHVLNLGTSHQKLDMDPTEFAVIIFIGTNDVGLNSFITDSQNPALSLPDVAGCQLQAIRNLHALGVRRFIVNSLIPLHLTQLYSNSSAPTIYHPEPHDGNGWYKRMFNIVNSLNALIKNGLDDLNQEWRGSATVDFFNTYDFFADMYAEPNKWFNGSIPANVTGHCHQCPDPNDFRQCGVLVLCSCQKNDSLKIFNSGDCTLPERDSYMW
jgi:hypothetical protein